MRGIRIVIVGLSAMAVVIGSDRAEGRQVGTAIGMQPEPSAYRPNEVVITLERTICFGTCPIYTVAIIGDGTVKYEGRQFVGAVGPREDKIGLDQVTRVINAFLRVRIFDAADEYDDQEMVELKDNQFVRLRGTVTDLPSQIVTIQLGSRKKRVVLRYNYPAELGGLPGLIDDVAQTKRWTAQVK